MAAEAKALFEQGVRAFRANEKAKARQLIKEALVLAPDNEQGWLLYARMLDDNDKRLKCIERALKINPTSAVALEMQRRLLAKMGADSTDDFDDEPSPAARNKTAANRQQAQPSELGAQLMLRSIPVTGQVLRGLGAIVFAALGCGAILFAVATGLQPDGVLPLVSICALFFGLAGLAVFQFVRLFGRQIAIHENGVTLLSEGIALSVVYWSEVDAITYQDQTIEDHYGLLLTSKMVNFHVKLFQDNRKIFDLAKHYADYRELGGLILNKVQPVILSKLLHTLKRGGEVKIGKIVMTLAGIQQGKREVRWGDIADLSPAIMGFAALLHDGKKVGFSYNTENDANAHLLPDLIATMTKNTSSGSYRFR